jgi:Ser/Thr protein kinase RdoA (MazF antagonist)
MGDEIAIDSVLAAFGYAGAPTEPIVVGHIHSTYAVDTQGGAFVLQRVNPLFPIGIHDNIRAVTDALTARGVATLELVPALDGALVADFGSDGIWRLLTRVPGISHEVCPSAAHAREAGGLAARFHSALLDLTYAFHPLGFCWHDTAQHFRDLEEALRNHPNHPLQADIRSLAARIRRHAEAWPPLGDLPHRVVHTDLKFNNLLFDPAGEPSEPRALSLIDLDTVCRLPLYIELGDAWRSWCNRRAEDSGEAEFDLEIFRASVTGYLGEVEFELDAGERDSLAQGVERISIELASRFAADALNEGYFGWDPERFESHGVHNWVRARGQLALAEQARASHTEQLRVLTSEGPR